MTNVLPFVQHKMSAIVKEKEEDFYICVLQVISSVQRRQKHFL